jgi:predicted nucleic acid-binding protein
VTFVDTSALLAFLDRGAADHDAVVKLMAPLLAERRGVTHDDEALALGRRFREAGFSVKP